MLDEMTTQNEHKAIEAELVNASFRNANDLNFAGVLILSLLVFVVQDVTPWWTWLPGLVFLYLVTLLRAIEIRRYRRTPEYRNSRQWVLRQTVYSGLAGVCWGVVSTLLLMYLPTALQLFVLTVSTVVAATTASEDIVLVLPPRVFILASISPPVLWMLSQGDQMYIVLAIMLLAFLSIVITIGNKKSHLFTEAQHLRFQNEFLAKELSRQRDLLERTNKSKSRFLAAASHDLRQPVAALMIFLEQLEFEQHLSVKGKGVLEHAQHATSSMCSLLDSLLDISRLDGQAIRKSIRPFSIRKLFDEMEDEFRQLAEQKGLRLKFSTCSAVIESDRVLMGQILRNLVSNAIRYTPAGRILVGCRHRQGMLSIEVHDTGIGIAEDQLPKIFDEFYQVDNSERDRQQGLGLGLSIVDRAARLLGHTLTLTSRLGIGSSFALTVPLAKIGVAKEQPVPLQAATAPVLAGRLIAVIENEGSIRAGMNNLLQSWGCRVVFADSATNMIEQLDSMGGIVEMIISDFGLRGGVNGVEAIARIRQRWGSELPALLFTGDISKETHTLAKNAGLSILYKPAKAETLCEAITDAFGSFDIQKPKNRIPDPNEKIDLQAKCNE
jgi:signal transduction histidine kinase/CheY-like chemotaxis protein